MTKAELIKALEQTNDDAEISVDRGAGKSMKTMKTMNTRFGPADMETSRAGYVLRLKSTGKEVYRAASHFDMLDFLDSYNPMSRAIVEELDRDGNVLRTQYADEWYADNL